MYLSKPLEEIEDRYTVVVVGSGYGGGITASRMSRAGQSVCVLERGREFQPGEYPDTTPETLAETQIDTSDGHLGSRLGLLDFSVGKDINVLRGCGLGGTSLINANVSIRADRRVFADPRWPKEIRSNPDALNAGYDRAIEMLRPNPYPKTSLPLAKLEAQKTSAAAMRADFLEAAINVNFHELEGGLNHVGVQQAACTLCGDCVTGCNHRAKNTTLMNYLPDACNHGAHIFTAVTVRSVARGPSGWEVRYCPVDSGRDAFDDRDEMTVFADIVVLAAGALGSTELLLRSKQRGLAISEKIGHGFTGNGDVLAFGYNTDQRIDGVGAGHRPPDRIDTPRPGPCITGVIDLRGPGPLDEGMIIEEGSIPGSMAPTLPGVFVAAARVSGTDTGSGVAHLVAERGRELESLVGGAYHGAIRNTQTYLVMAHDGASGQMVLEDDRLRINWPGVGGQGVFQRANANLRAATKALGGTFVENPFWLRESTHPLVTVHPLGGCPMADEAANGVVNHKGQVFSGPDGNGVYEGLYVSDGAVIPRSLGVNPLLTISALAERCCALMAADRGWVIPYALPSKPSAPPPPRPLGVEFTERMAGYISTTVLDEDYARAYEDGKNKGSSFAFVVTIGVGDLARLISDETYLSDMVGSVEAPELSPEPLTVTGGKFSLFITDPNRVEGKQMRYRMRLDAVDGSQFLLEGFKLIHDDPGFDLWSDTTTLYVTLSRGDGAAKQVVGRGILRIAPTDLMRQLTTIKAINATSAAERLETVATFGKYFAGTLWHVYGGVAAGDTLFDPDAPARKKRPLRAPTPTLHALPVSDLQLRLTRYEGGTKGPVLLAHGLGVSSLIFTIDTIETNLVEYLVAHGYDVWLLDYRSSIALPAAATQYSADDIATQDFPAAVRRVREITAAKSVQVIAHCFGGTTFTMAMLAGLEGVRSAVISQVSAHAVVPTLTKLKTGLHFPGTLDLLGVKSLTAYVDKHADWKAKLLDDALRLYPVGANERCRSAVCHRISFLYAPLYEHAQLNQATHLALHEMFQLATIRAFEHLARIANVGHVVGFDGAESYLPHLDRMAVPIAFIHGARNQCYLPESTQKTLEALRQANPSIPYRRYEIPDYGHIDCIFGKDAARDVYPHIVAHLDETAGAG